MAGTMGRLSIGVTGLQTNQYALNATAHNLTNTQTEGYSRQQVLLTDRTYHTISYRAQGTNQTGLGVVTAEIKQSRDTFADLAYRAESGRMDYYKAQYETVSEIETYFGELEGQDFNTTMNNLWLAMQEVQKESNSIVTRSSLIATAQNFLERVQNIRSSLINYQRNLNESITDQVNRINTLAETINKLNVDILKAEAAGIENANDYRDARNLAIDELSGLVKTETIHNTDGTVEIYIEGSLMVTRGKTYKLAAMKITENEAFTAEYPFTKDSTDYLMPVWADDERPLFNIERIPSTNANSDIGSLKGLIMSRGYFVSNFTDVPVKPEKPVAEKYETDAEYQDAMTQYTADLRDYVDKLDYFNKYVEPYTITNLMAQFDVMTHAMMTQINDVLCPNKEVTLLGGQKIHILDEEKAGLGMGIGNDYPGTELFTRKDTERYTRQTITLADGTVLANAYVYNEEDPNDVMSLYSSGYVEINPELQKNPSLLPLSRVSGEEAQEVADAMLALWDVKFSTVSPNSLVFCNYKDYYAGMMEDLADRGYTYNAMAETQMQTVQDIENTRQQVLGVSSDEELSNMIRFQHAYNASSRYINTVSEMIEHLINTLGA
ncbi:MAG: flagellar basal body rod C-terminal domain-containing protein [Eubacteriales bacterium]|nr:flagellar basal body rod C-terminal domain-containing protein [Eubacteriales bacterium]